MRLTFEWITHTRNLSLAALTNECLNADVDVDKIVASFGVDVVASFFRIVIDSKIAAAVSAAM